MADYLRDLEQILLKHGCTLISTKGKHPKWSSPINNHHFPVPTKIPDKHIANAIIKQAGITGERI